MENKDDKDSGFKKFLETLKKQNDIANAAQAVSDKKEDKQTESLERIASLLEKIQANFAIKPSFNNTDVKSAPSKDGILNRAALSLSEYKVDPADKTITEQLKEEIAAAKSVFGSIGKGISSIFSAGKGLLTNPKDTFAKGLEKAKGVGKAASDILSTKADYTVEKERFAKEVQAQGGENGEALYDSLMERSKVEKKKRDPLTRIVSDVLGKKEAPSKEPKPTVDANEENDNYVSAQEKLADNSDKDLELTQQILDVQKQQLAELKRLSETLSPKIPGELPGAAPTVSKKDSEEESGNGLGLLDALPGKGIFKSIGKGAKALGKAGTGLLKFAGSRAGMVAGGALAIGAGAYTAYKGFKGAEEEKQAGLQEIEAKQQAGEITPEEAEAQKKQLGEATVEKKGGAIGEGTGMAAGGIVGMKAGAALGATIGSAVPVVGTAIGAGVGAIAGGALGAFAGSKAGKTVGEYGGKAVNAAGNLFKSVKDSFGRGTSGTLAFQNQDEEINKRAKEAGAIDETGKIIDADKYNQISKEVKTEILAKDKSANKSSDLSVSSKFELISKDEMGPDGATSTNTFTKGIVSEKSILGSTKLGALFSAKGLDTGRFLSSGSEESIDKEGNIKSKFSDISGSRKSGGLLGADTYSLTNEGAQGGPVYDMQVSKKDYMRIQSLAKEGKHADVEKEFADLKAKRDMTYQDYSPVTSPEESVTPMSDKPSKSIFDRLGDKIKGTYGYIKKQAGLDLSGGVGKEQAEQLISSKSTFDQKETQKDGVVTASNALNTGITSEKSLFGSKFLGSLFSKKGQETGSFLAQGEETTSTGDTASSKFGTLMGKRESGGLFGRDKYTVSREGKDGGAEYDTPVTKKDYNKLQALAKEGKYDEADVEFKKIKEQQERDKEIIATYSTPDDKVTPLANKTAVGSKLAQDSIENKDLDREASKPVAAAQPIVSTNVSNNNKTVITPPKPTPRNTELDVSPLKDYQRRSTVF